MSTYLPKVKDIKRRWVEIDASVRPLGRMATTAANILRGKDKAIFTPHMDVGDFVVVINADKVKLTGRKILQKEYIRFSGYPGGIRRQKMKDVLAKNPDRIIREAIRNMLAPTRLRRAILNRLKVVTGSNHNFKIDKKV